MARVFKPLLHSMIVRKVTNKRFEIIGSGKGNLKPGGGISAILYVPPTVSGAGVTTFSWDEVPDGVVDDLDIDSHVIHTGPAGSTAAKHKQTAVKIDLKFTNNLVAADRYLLLVTSASPHARSMVPMWIPINLDVPA